MMRSEQESQDALAALVGDLAAFRAMAAVSAGRSVFAVLVGVGCLGSVLTAVSVVATGRGSMVCHFMWTGCLIAVEAGSECPPIVGSVKTGIRLDGCSLVNNARLSRSSTEGEWASAMSASCTFSSGSGRDCLSEVF